MLTLQLYPDKRWTLVVLMYTFTFLDATGHMPVSIDRWVAN